MRRALSGARPLAGVPPRLSPKGIIPSQRLSFRPGFLGRDLNGRYPPSPVPVQGCTTPVIMPGDMMPKPPGYQVDRVRVYIYACNYVIFTEFSEPVRYQEYYR